jgi:transcription elongation GreA/GreB family factor
VGEVQKALTDAEEAREKAENKAREEQHAREKAENKAREEQAAFQLRIQELEAALRATQGGAPSP